MVEAARARGLQEIAITDHGPDNLTWGVDSAATYLEIKQEVAELNQHYDDIRVLVGSEADIIGLDGEIDIPPRIIKELDVLVVGLHPYIRPAGWPDGFSLIVNNQLGIFSKGIRHKANTANTKAVVEALHRYDVDFVSHPGLFMAVDYQEVARACVKTNTAFEINTGHEFPTLGAVLIAADEGVDFIVNSDAHYPDSVGRMDYGRAMIVQAQLPEERIINLREKEG